MKLVDTINETVKNVFGRVPTLLQLQAEDEQRKRVETLAEREAAYRELQDARERYSTEVPELEAQVARDRERLDAAKRELVEADRALAGSSATRLGRAAEFRNLIALHEGRLRQTAPPQITEFLRWALAEFEKLRLLGDTHISSGIDPSTGSPAVWIRTNSRAITAKLDRLKAARKRAQQLQLELGDFKDEIETLKTSIDTGGGLEIEEIKGRLVEPISPPYNRYDTRKAPLPSDPPTHRLVRMHLIKHMLKRAVSWFDLSDVIFIAATASLAYGLWLLNEALCFITIGVFFLVLTLYPKFRAGGKRNER